MLQLKDALTGPKRQAVVQDCVTLVDEEVAQKGGLSGLAVKTAYAVVTRVKPGLVAEVVDKLLDAFVDRLEPFYGAYRAGSQGQSLADAWSRRSGEIAESLLTLTDERAEKSQNAVLKGTYKKLRPTGVKHVQAAVPGIARVVAKHT